MRLALVAVLCAASARAQTLAVRGDLVHTAAGAAIRNGVVLVRDGKIERVGPAAEVSIPSGYQTLSAQVVTPGLIDGHATAGMSGYLNQPHDQEQVERSAAMQPELRALDGYDPRERLVRYVRAFGTTTMHTGHGPGPLISGQTMIVKTAGDTTEAAAIVPAAMVAATLGNAAREPGPKAPGTRAKMIAMLREQLIKAKEYDAKKPAARDLRIEALVPVVKGEMPLLLTVHRANDILTALRLGKEFGLKLVLDGASDAHLLLDEIKSSGYPVILHPTMARAFGDTENLSMETASLLAQRGIPFALQTGFESYVPKTRIILFEAAVAAANALGPEAALRSVTIDAARILGIDKRVGSLEPGKDADIALFDGDPFEYTSHCVGVVIDGKVAGGNEREAWPSSQPR